MSRDEFPRPCKNCGNPAMMHKGNLVHVRGKRSRCNTFVDWSFVRDKKGQVAQMLGGNRITIPDPLTQEQIDSQKLKEWNELYQPQPGESAKEGQP
jgi:hypothetical protein